MKKEQLLGKIDVAWSALQESYAGLSESQLTEPGVTGEWSVKDILAHVTTWEEEALHHLPGILAGKRPPRYADLYGGIDAFNALKTEENRQRSLADVLIRLAETHARLVAYVAAAPEEQFTTDTRFRRRIRLDAYGHYPIHTRAISEWRVSKGI